MYNFVISGTLASRALGGRLVCLACCLIVGLFYVTCATTTMCHIRFINNGIGISSQFSSLCIARIYRQEVQTALQQTCSLHAQT
jgi:hypothetical protein